MGIYQRPTSLYPRPLKRNLVLLSVGGAVCCSSKFQQSKLFSPVDRCHLHQISLLTEVCQEYTAPHLLPPTALVQVRGKVRREKGRRPSRGPTAGSAASCAERARNPRNQGPCLPRTTSGSPGSPFLERVRPTRVGPRADPSYLLEASEVEARTCRWAPGPGGGGDTGGDTARALGPGGGGDAGRWVRVAGGDTGERWRGGSGQGALVTPRLPPEPATRTPAAPAPPPPGMPAPCPPPRPESPPLPSSLPRARGAGKSRPATLIPKREKSTAALPSILH